MCLAIPGQVLTVDSASEPWNRSGRVRFGTIEKTINLAYAPDAAVGDYVLVHVGFALQRIDPEEAERTLEILREMEELQELETVAAPPQGVRAPRPHLPQELEELEIPAAPPLLDPS